MPEAKKEKLGARRQKSHAALRGLVDYFAVWKNTREQVERHSPIAPRR
jgi:hypothetical protein